MSAFLMKNISPSLKASADFIFSVMKPAQKQKGMSAASACKINLFSVFVSVGSYWAAANSLQTQHCKKRII